MFENDNLYEFMPVNFMGKKGHLFELTSIHIT